MVLVEGDWGPFSRGSWVVFRGTMDDDILVRCSALKITEEEDEVVNLTELGTDISASPSMELALVGKVMTRRSYNFDAFKKTMNQIWSITKDALFRPIEHGLFVVQFATARDRTKVLAGRPWTFDQNLVAMHEIDGGLQPSEVVIDSCPFWVRLYNIPLNSRSEEHIRILGSHVGRVIEVEYDGIMWNSSARIRILVNLNKPLRRIIKLRTNADRVVMVEVKYERLPIFCYCCGMVGHMERDCLEVVEDEKGGDKQWGPWLKASPRRGGAKQMEEAKQFLSCGRRMTFARQEVVAVKRSLTETHEREASISLPDEAMKGDKEVLRRKVWSGDEGM